MAAEVVRVYKEHVPALRFIGERYTNDDRNQNDGGFGGQWNEWFAHDRFKALANSVGVASFSDDPVGLMTMSRDMVDFTYWIGFFFPQDTPVPDGYDFLDLPESDLGVGWVRGREDNGEIYGSAHELVCKELEDVGLGSFRDDIGGESSGIFCFFERYNCPRFTEMDEDSYVTLDYGNYIWPQE